VAIDTLDDMEILFEGLPVDHLTTSMTINPPASILWAMYISCLATHQMMNINSDVISSEVRNCVRSPRFLPSREPAIF
jgi:methylmalonyl-CoA mutase N-terminal domain/subunit